MSLSSLSRIDSSTSSSGSFTGCLTRFELWFKKTLWLTLGLSLFDSLLLFYLECSFELKFSLGTTYVLAELLTRILVSVVAGLLVLSFIYWIGLDSC